jgi:hypothetical protein
MINDLAAANAQGMRSPITEAFKPLRNGFQLFAQFPIVPWMPLVIETGTLEPNQGATTPQGKPSSVHPFHSLPALLRLHQFFDS